MTMWKTYTAHNAWIKTGWMEMVDPGTFVCMMLPFIPTSAAGKRMDRFYSSRKESFTTKN